MSEQTSTGAYDFMGELLDYETGDMDTKERAVTLFQYLIDSGMAWSLQGHYGRTADAMIKQGYCTFGPTPYTNIYGSTIPSVSQVEAGSVGSREYVAFKTKEREEAAEDEDEEEEEAVFYEEDNDEEEDFDRDEELGF